MFCHEEKLVTVRQKANLSKSLTHISIRLKQYVIDRFIYLHCSKYVPMKATQVTKCKGFYSFKLEEKTKRKILKLNIFYLVEKIMRLTWKRFSSTVQTANQDRLSVINEAHGSRSMGSWLSVLVDFSISYNTIFLSSRSIAEAAH